MKRFLEGEATREQGRLLTTLADLRQQADYEHEPVDEDVEHLLDRTSEFVVEMEDIADQLAED